MSISRRDFVKGCAAVCVLSVPGIAIAAKSASQAVASGSALNIEKSIKASFGGGFSLRAHSQAGLSEIPCLRRVEHYTERRLNRSS